MLCVESDSGSLRGENVLDFYAGECFVARQTENEVRAIQTMRTRI